ncbi:MAG: hypothetical protein OXI67_10435 [Candidatus Poribacteria bacterium]|nr:hypothetical protein [Candidatus Poribacteria bacterium]
MFLRRIIEWINSLEAGHHFRKQASFFVKISGVFILIASFVLGIVFLVVALMFTRTSSVGAQAFVIIGTVIGLVIIGIVGTTLTMLFWNRAKKIVSAGEESHLIFGPIAGIVIRLSGEAAFIGFIGGGLLCLVCSIFGAAAFGWLALISLVFAFLLPLIAVVSLQFSYLISEYASLIGDIATNIKKIETALSTDATAAPTSETVASEKDL